MQLFVDINASENGNGSQARPFKTIQQAADVARAGDYVQIMPGTYREEVHPQFSGTADKPIIYAATVQNQVVVTGAERVTGWQEIGNGVWAVKIPNQRFGNYNPYKIVLDETFNHAGEVFLNNQAMYEVDQLSKVTDPEQHELAHNPAFSRCSWYTEQSTTADATVIYANFQGKDPNVEPVELTFRETCFSPTKANINYLILSGFTFTMAACRWATSTYQPGMVSTNDGQGWKIAKCDLSHAKCVALSLGRGDGITANAATHRIKNNTIHDCGQAGIWGVSGNPAPIIEHNHLYKINTRHNLHGETASAISLAPAIGAQIRRNYIHDCTRGISLSGRVINTQISRNVFYQNSLPQSFSVTSHNRDNLLAALGEDIRIKNISGENLLDNNFLLSDYALRLTSGDVLAQHNLINGNISWEETERGDLHNEARLPQFYNNIFIRKQFRDEMAKLLTIAHKQSHTQVDNDEAVGQATGNLYFNDGQEEVKVDIAAKNNGIYFDSNLCDYLVEDTSEAVDTQQELAADLDFLGQPREGCSVTAGPFDAKADYQQRLFRLLF